MVKKNKNSIVEITDKRANLYKTQAERLAFWEGVNWGFNTHKGLSKPIQWKH